MHQGIHACGHLSSSVMPYNHRYFPDKPRYCVHTNLDSVSRQTSVSLHTNLDGERSSPHKHRDAPQTNLVSVQETNIDVCVETCDLMPEKQTNLDTPYDCFCNLLVDLPEIYLLPSLATEKCVRVASNRAPYCQIRPYKPRASRLTLGSSRHSADPSPYKHRASSPAFG